MNIVDFISKSGLTEKLGQQNSLDESKVKKVIEGFMPQLSEAINNNSKDDAGLEAFYKALKDHEKDDIKSMLNDVNKIDTEDGNKIINHILGDKRAKAEEEISKKTSVDKTAVSNLMNTMGPIVMGLMGKQVSKVEDKKAAPNLVNTLLGGDGLKEIAKSFLDKDGDGNILDDLASMLFK